MNALPWAAIAWLALGAAIGVVPVPSVAGFRTHALARRGRLVAVAVPDRDASWSRPRAPTLGLLGCAACAVAAGVVGGPAIGVAVALVAATVAGSISSALSARRAARRRRELLTSVRLLVAELESGSRSAAALRAAAAVAPQHAEALAAAGAAAETGSDAAGTLFASGARDLAPLAHAWRVGALTGAPMADVLGRVAADLSDDDDRHRAVAVALAGPRSSAALLAGLPVVGIALGAAMGARPLTFLFGSSAGRLVCCIGVALDAAGVLWTQRLMRRVQQS